MTRDTWEGDAYRPLSFNRWNYVEGNPINRKDPSGRCWYWDAETGEVKIDITEGNASEPCGWFEDITNSVGINVTTPNSLPPELKALLYCGDNESHNLINAAYVSPYPSFGTPTNFGNYLTAYSLPGVSGTYMQFGGHAEYDDSTGAGAIFTVTASVNFIIGVGIEKYQYATIIRISENYEPHPPFWVEADGVVDLRINTNTKSHTINLGDINYGKLKQNRETPLVFYGESEFPRLLKITFFTWMTETWLTRSVNESVTIQVH